MFKNNINNTKYNWLAPTLNNTSLRKNKIGKFYKKIQGIVMIPKCGTFVFSCSVVIVVGCGAATFGREPLRYDPRVCCVGFNDESTVSIGPGGGIILARRLLELTWNHVASTLQSRFNFFCLFTSYQVTLIHQFIHSVYGR